MDATVVDLAAGKSTVSAFSRELSVPTSVNVKDAKTENSRMKHPMETVATSRSQYHTRLQLTLSANNQSVCDEEARHQSCQL